MPPMPPPMSVVDGMAAGFFFFLAVFLAAAFLGDAFFAFFLAFLAFFAPFLAAFLAFFFATVRTSYLPAPPHRTARWVVRANPDPRCPDQSLPCDHRPVGRPNPR